MPPFTAFVYLALSAIDYSFVSVMVKWVDGVALALAAATVASLQFLPELPLEWEMRSSDLCCFLGFAACLGIVMAE